MDSKVSKEMSSNLSAARKDSNEIVSDARVTKQGPAEAQLDQLLQDTHIEDPMSTQCAPRFDSKLNIHIQSLQSRRLGSLTKSS